jgi:hypothetical protein
MLPLSITSLFITAVFSLPTTELNYSKSGVNPQYSGVFTSEHRCGAWYLFSSCADGYECVDKQCILVNQEQPEIIESDVPEVAVTGSTTRTSTRTSARTSTTTSTTTTSSAGAPRATRPACSTNMHWESSDNRCVCNDTYNWDVTARTCVWRNPNPPAAAAPQAAQPARQPAAAQPAAAQPAAAQPAAAAPAPQPAARPASSSTSFTFYDPTTGGGACAGVRYSQADFVVALATDLYAGGSRCGQTIYLNAGGKTVQATVVDQCLVAGGCEPGNIDSTVAVWRALGLNTDLGRTRISYHF